ncbi:geranylgeranylglycerol-phosphate geranylgeranyltransferase [Vulcanisaeta thermophila]|uniref:geranylgeranylglycerol-phosphate geranylgeranyltransferase n=1 Tax=Vulcanisaeta thermophila TaxID=867917 RepID=UPI0008538504|nr:geranylgeranylglycerol-phosphate geranylgeranyltransferase [Vulcanisaeta thermophila]
MGIKPILKLARIEHGVLAGLIVVATYFICGGTNPLGSLALFLSTLLAEVFLFVTNDIHNVGEDRVNRPDAPLVRGDVGMGVAWALALVSVALSIVVNLLGVLLLGLSPWSLLVLIAALLMGYLYNYRLKRVLLVNNILVSITSSLTLLYGLYSVVETPLYALPYALFITSALATMGRELIKGVLDIRGDELVGVRTVANTYGTRRAVSMAVAFTVAAILTSTLLILYSLNLRFGYVFITGVLITDVILAYLSVMVMRREDYLGRFRGGALLAMSITIITYLVMALLQVVIP